MKTNPTDRSKPRSLLRFSFGVKALAVLGFVVSLTSLARAETPFDADIKNNPLAVSPDEHLAERIPVGKDPYGAALTPDGRFVYSGNKADNSLSVIDTGTRKVVATIPGFQEPRQAIVFTKDGKTAYVLNKDLSIAVVDTTTRQIVRTLTPAAVQAR